MYFILSADRRRRLALLVLRGRNALQSGAGHFRQSGGYRRLFVRFIGHFDKTLPGSRNSRATSVNRRAMLS